MKASKFSNAQKAFILKQGADGIPVADICRKARVSQATYFNWKEKYDGMLPPDMRRLKQLEMNTRRRSRSMSRARWTRTSTLTPRSAIIRAAALGAAAISTPNPGYCAGPGARTTWNIAIFDVGPAGLHPT